MVTKQDPDSATHLLLGGESVAAHPQSPHLCTCRVPVEVGLTATSNDAYLRTPVVGSSNFSSTKPVQLERCECDFQ